MRVDVCPTSAILPVFKRITSPRALHVYPALTYTPCTDFNAQTMQWLRRYLGTYCAPVLWISDYQGVREISSERGTPHALASSAVRAAYRGTRKCLNRA
jgi:hypothetical protein